MIRTFLSVLLLVILVGSVRGQDILNRDSLLRLEKQAGRDSAAAMLYISIGQQYENDQPETAKSWYKKAGDLSRSIGFQTGIIKYIFNYTYVLNLQGRFDSSYQLNKEGILLARRMNDSLNLSKAIFNTANACVYGGRYEEATGLYIEAQRIFALRHNDQFAEQCSDALQVLYENMHRYKEAITYGEQAVKQAREAGMTPQLGMALNNLAIHYNSLKNPEKAFPLLQEALAISTTSQNVKLRESVLLNLAGAYKLSGQYDKITPLCNEAYKLAQQFNDQDGQAESLFGLAIAKMHQQQYEEARSFGAQALGLARENSMTARVRDILLLLSDIALAQHDLNAYESYRKQGDIVADSLLNEELNRNTQEMETRYGKEKNEMKIRELENKQQIQAYSIRQKNLLNILLATGILAVILISVLAYRNNKQYQKLQQQRIQELETEQQLSAAEAVMKGEEQERTRLAKDLHDGLGGMLSGIKFSFQHMKENLVMTPENQQAFERSVDMLDSSISELRRVAHNMMPEVLLKFGLDRALQDFCNDINRSGVVHISYQSLNLEGKTIAQTTAINLYRIVQELISNILRHAAAREAIVQISYEEAGMTLTVEDDGKGFNADDPANQGGAGWLNIRSRIGYMKGKLDIRSTPGKGTSVQIEVPV